MRASRGNRSLSAVVMAAGEGTRMKSRRPKPLHRLCGRPMVLHVLDAVAGMQGDGDHPDLALERAVVVVGHGAERVTKALSGDALPAVRLDFVTQAVQRGTGDAVAVALTAFPDEDPDDDADLLVLPGDTPLLRSATLAALVEAHRAAGAAATVLTARLADPRGYGRVVRGKGGRVQKIVEDRDASPDEKAIDEINTSIYCFRRAILGPALRRLTPMNAQGEYYLTDVIEVLYDAGYTVTSYVADDPTEAAGVNDRLQLAAAEAELRRRTNARWMSLGVTMIDPDRTYVDATVHLSADVTLFPGTMLQGATVVGVGCEIGPETRLVDCRVGDGAVVANTVGRRADIGPGAQVGPFAALGPGARLAPGAVTGPFFRSDGPAGS